MNNIYTIEYIKEKQDELEIVRAELYKSFVGIDDVIDQVITAITGWYIFPDLLTRPTIINLWGMTGTGKTALVRRLAELLHMTKHYIERIMTRSDINYNDIEYDIEQNMPPKVQGILLLDEIQRFRTIGKMGEDLNNNKDQDIWELISDGSFTSCFSRITRIEFRILTILSNQTNTTKKDMVYQYDYSNAIDDIKYEFPGIIIPYVKDSKGVNTISKTWILNKLTEIIENNKNHSRDVYTKLLIIICGNIDEAYSSLIDGSNVDIDADILHEFSKKVTFIDIKECLSNMFRQEQLARFGNVHILYPSLSKANYYELIKKTINSICDQIYKESGFKIEVQQSLHDLIYRNGVFPAQGARPLFQTISKVFNSIVPDILSNMIKTDSKNCCIIANNETSNIELILPNNNDNIINYHIDCDIDKIKHHTDPNRESIIAIHEAGHAIAFMDIFGYTPTQICINKVNQNGTGFTSTSIVEHTINNNLKQIIIKLSGYLTEELVLGKDHVSCGYYSDLLGATNIAANLIRSFGINPSTYGTMSIGEDNQLTDINKTDSLITDILNECKERASKLVYQHQDEIKSLSKLLLDKKNVKATEIHEIMKNYFPNLKIPIENQIVGIEDYSDKIGGWINSPFSTSKKGLRSSKKTIKADRYE